MHIKVPLGKLNNERLVPLSDDALALVYATALLNAGMSLVSVMKILGHRSYRMTLRYAAITQETVGKEYRQALEQLENKYIDALPIRTDRCQPMNPIKMLSDVNRWLKSNITDDPNGRRDVTLLTKRINSIKLDISNLLLTPK